MPRPGSFLGDLVDLARSSRFRRLFATRLTAQSADGMTTVALTSFVFFSPERQATARDAALAFAATLLPYSLVGPFAGVLLDRWRRQRILLRASLVKAALVLVLALFVGLDYAGVGFFAVGLLILSVNRFYLSALSAALPHVVPERELVMANSVSTTSGTASALLGAGLAFGLRTLLGGGHVAQAGALIGAVALCVAASAAASRIPADELGPDLAHTPPPFTHALGVVARGMAEGARHVAHKRAALRALSAIAAHRFVYGLWTVSTLLLYRNTLHDPDDTDAALADLAQVVAASGVGYFLAALVTPEVTGRVRKSTWISVLLAGAALTQVAATMLPLEHASVVGTAFVLGIAAQGVKICVDTIIQQSVEDRFRGRVFSLYDTVFNVTFVSAAVAAAVLVPSGGVSSSLSWVMAGTYALAAAVYAYVSRHAPDPAEAPTHVVTPAHATG